MTAVMRYEVIAHVRDGQWEIYIPETQVDPVTVRGLSSVESMAKIIISGALGTPKDDIVLEIKIGAGDHHRLELELAQLQERRQLAAKERDQIQKESVFLAGLLHKGGANTHDIASLMGIPAPHVTDLLRKGGHL